MIDEAILLNADFVPRSSSQDIAASDLVFATMVRLACASKDQGRGIVFYELGDTALTYYSLLDLQKSGPDLVGATTELFRDLLITVGSGYDFATEFVLVSPKRGELTTFVAQICPLREDGRKFVRSDEQIKTEVARSQKMIAKAMFEQMRSQRKGKKR
jgi:hypothetical protein